MPLTDAEFAFLSAYIKEEFELDPNRSPAHQALKDKGMLPHHFGKVFDFKHLWQERCRETGHDFFDPATGIILPVPPAPCPWPDLPTFLRRWAQVKPKSLAIVMTLYRAHPAARQPEAGAYYWLPHPNDGLVAWDLMTGHDLGRTDTAPHHELWPDVIELLAASWQKDSRELKRRLLDHHEGLPRGRVIRPEGRHLILHGDDTPVPDGLDLVISRFHLDHVEATPEFADHYRMLATDTAAVEVALGIHLNA